MKAVGPVLQQENRTVRFLCAPQAGLTHPCPSSSAHPSAGGLPGAGPGRACRRRHPHTPPHGSSSAGSTLPAPAAAPHRQRPGHGRQAAGAGCQQRRPLAAQHPGGCCLHVSSLLCRCRRALDAARGLDAHACQLELNRPVGCQPRLPPFPCAKGLDCDLTLTATAPHHRDLPPLLLLLPSPEPPPCLKSPCPSTV